MFVGAGQFYIGGTASNIDNTFRQVVSTSAGTFKLQKRISGTFTDALAFDSSLNATFAGNVLAKTGIFQVSSGDTLILRKGTGTPGISFQGTATDQEVTGLIEGISGGGLKFYTSSGTVSAPAYSVKITLAAGGTTTFAGQINAEEALFNGKLKIYDDGTLNWGAAQDSGRLTYDTGVAIVAGLSGQSLVLRSNGSGSSNTALTLDTSQNATFAEDVKLGDDKRLILGASTDGTIQYDGTNDELEIKTAADASEISLIAGTTNTYTSEIQIGARSSLQGEGIFFKTRSVERMRIKSSGSIYSVNSIQGTYFGQDAGNPASVTGVGNTSIGYATAQLLTSGAQNTSVGRSASVNLTTGSNNTAIGKEALFALIGGDNNTAIGTSAGSI